MLSVIKKQLNRIVFMAQSGTTLRVMFLYIAYGLKKWINYQSAYSGTYFSGNLPYWQELFLKFEVRPGNILEIGSFRGDSAKVLLDCFGHSKITCVDTWSGGDEHSSIEFAEIEKSFDEFAGQYNQRVTKSKGTSVEFFLSQQSRYDLIYIDGSHFADDVLIDLLKAWQVLNVGGVMICDDYIWDRYKRIRDNPCAAINAFLSLKKGEYRVLAVYRQIWLRKTCPVG